MYQQDLKQNKENKGKCCIFKQTLAGHDNKNSIMYSKAIYFKHNDSENSAKFKMWPQSDTDNSENCIEGHILNWGIGKERHLLQVLSPSLKPGTMQYTS